MPLASVPHLELWSNCSAWHSAPDPQPGEWDRPTGEKQMISVLLLVTSHCYGPADILPRCVQGSWVVRSHRFRVRELCEHIGTDAWHMSSQEKLQILSDGDTASLLKSNTHHYIPLGLGKRIDFFSTARHSREAGLETNMSSDILHFSKYTISLPSDQRIYFIRKKN